MDLKVLSILLSVAAGLVVHPEPEMTQAFDKFISKHPSCMREILCFIDEVRYIIFHGEMIAGAPSYLQLKSPMSARKHRGTPLLLWFDCTCVPSPKSKVPEKLQVPWCGRSDRTCIKW